jgi:hypothetical protein
MVPANVLLSEQKFFGSFFQKRTAFFRLRLLEELEAFGGSRFLLPPDHA